MYLILILQVFSLILSCIGLTMGILSLRHKKKDTKEKVDTKKDTEQIQIKVIIINTVQEKKSLPQKEPFQPRDLRGIYFYCYDDCEPVLSRHLKEGEEPVAMHFGMDAPPYNEETKVE